MPGCAFKTCKNSFYNTRKRMGITFHRFPTDKDVQEKWTAAVRTNRKNSKWVPSKSSVICSVHFDESDIYLTIQGNCRVKRSAYPKKLLTSDSNAVLPNEPSTSERLVYNVIYDGNTTSPSPSCSSPKPDIDEVSDENMEISIPYNILTSVSNIQSPTSDPLKNSQSSMDLNPAAPFPSSFLTACPKCAHQFWVSASMHICKTKSCNKWSQDSCLLPNATTDKDLSYSVIPDSCLLSNTTTDKASSSSPVSIIPAETTTEQDLPIFDTPRKHKLRQKLQFKDRLLKNNKNKIKILQQKVRRLEKRNRSLKDIIRDLKTQTFISPELCNSLEITLQ